MSSFLFDWYSETRRNLFVLRCDKMRNSLIVSMFLFDWNSEKAVFIIRKTNQ
jgi:hypothetical protein